MYILKWYSDQRNAQVFNVRIYLFTSALHVSGFLLARLQGQVYNFGSGSSLLGMVSAPGLTAVRTGYFLHRYECKGNPYQRSHISIKWFCIVDSYV
jgi:hypothetical protein